MNEDDFERRLRETLHSRRLRIDPEPGALDRIHEGARRRQRRQRFATSGVAALAVVALAVTGVVLRPGQHQAVTADKQPDKQASPSISSASSPQTSAPPEKKFMASEPVPPSLTAVPTPTGFWPLSVSAVSVDKYWVLGSDDCNAFHCLALKMTSDGGKTFTSLAAPALAGAPDGVGAKGWIASEIRFGSGTVGWAYGGAGPESYFFQTTDGGKSWSRVTSIPGKVLDLVAADGTAWAVVLLSPENSTTRRFAIYSTPYGDSQPQKWSPVALPLKDLGGNAPSIVAQSGVVTILASGPPQPGGRDHVLIAKAGSRFTDYQGPCSQDLGGRLSNSVKAIWAVCPSGMMAGLSVSTDRGVTWQAQKNSVELANSAAVGAIDDQHAMVMTPDGLLRLGADGSSQKADEPTGNAVNADFIGFTNQSTGFAIIDQQDGTARLLRTTDDGLHWSEVTFSQP
jgi:photosystem II stability/assembly factor-like uncharacterized protein